MTTTNEDLQRAIELIAQERVQRERACTLAIEAVLKDHHCALLLVSSCLDEATLRAVEGALRIGVAIKSL